MHTYPDAMQLPRCRVRAKFWEALTHPAFPCTIHCNLYPPIPRTTAQADLSTILLGIQVSSAYEAVSDFAESYTMTSKPLHHNCVAQISSSQGTPKAPPCDS